MSIIFLDMDGVLVHTDYENPVRYNIDPDKVNMLKYICDTCQASVVIISSWRGNEDWTPKPYKIMRQILQKAEIDVLGDAPYIPVKTKYIGKEPEPKIYNLEFLEKNFINIFGTGRGAEVTQYLLEHPTNSFVILDDEDWDWNDYHLKNHWVQPSYFDGGLKLEHAKQAIHILKEIQTWEKPYENPYQLCPTTTGQILTTAGIVQNQKKEKPAMDVKN